MYEDMLKIRLFEERAIKLFNKGLIRGPMHVYIGQEAVAVGACANLREEDYITSTHRGHGHCIAKGGELKKMTAELLGKATGYSKGKGGSMHIADPEIGILGANGIVGGGIGIAPGAALSAKMRGTDQVAVCFFGDGATNEGIFHESLNLAAVWELPIVYLCENNKYGLTSKADEVLAVEDVADRAASYDIPSEIVDGNDVVAVYEAVKRAVERAKDSGGPTLIEAKTYRWEGHFVGDPCVYRDDCEVEEWKERCPIDRLGELLVEEGATEEELKSIREQIEQDLDEAVDFAQSSPEPEVESIFADIFVD
ncbi:thiamine pyrophosphate-dependent dehydrogenase E1 component subunit alpha [Fuchsiella alkaliacetigena]|nr:thiamine pyrophosphate-dependent dehydrogenase E1 component subunit alpha [Fuchsiella alkaliacetigena]